MAEDRVPPHYRQNFVALAGDYIFFILASSFADSSTVLPSFARQLTASAPLIGLISTAQNGGWLLPQLIAANYVASKERKKPYIIWPCSVGRPLYLLLAVIAYFFGTARPTLTLLTLYLCLALFAACDGLASVPWFDVLSKALPGRRRGRYLATSQIVGGVLAIGGGAAVRRVLDPKTGLSFPQNYSLLFLCSFLFYMVSLVFLLFIKEPLESAHAERASWKSYFPILVATLRDDRPFRRIITARLLTGFAGMASPFFILYGVEGLGLGTAVIGFCLTAQVIGRIIGGGLLGLFIERLGNRLTVLGALSAVTMVPLLALGIGFWANAAPDRALLLYVYPLLFLLMGISMETVMWGYTNYVLDIAPPKERPTYVGLTNTITGLLVVAPIIGGTILQLTSYRVLFTVALAVYLLAWTVALRLPGTAIRR